MRFLPESKVRAGLLLLVMVMPVWATEPSEQLLLKADNGDVSAMFQMGVAFLSGKVSSSHSGKALQYLEQVASSHQSELSSQAKTWLGRAYRDALSGTDKDLKKSFSYFEQAAGKEGKNPEAQYELGKAYLNGMGTDRNLIAAYMWTAISLHKTSSVEAQAKEQKQQLTGMLNDLQLEKARELVTQLETLYLN
ncbi:hypothetical protein ACH42_00855 [Endozoicomonas sp. (ex Bugula neritina AB1)]|nr:hypothetical protein ACH42_00855 [Endozoicomonas sp. (ex Bugula neritina AB1)]